MRFLRHLIPTLILIGNIMVNFSAPAFGRSQPPPGPYVLGELLLAVRDGVSDAELQSIYVGQGGSLVKTIPQIKAHHIRVAPQSVDAVEAALRRNPKVKYVEKNYLAELSLTPNDPGYPNQWHLQKISAPAGWDITVGSDTVPIAILDSGIDPTHPDLAAKLLPGYNFVNGNTDIHDTFGHGTGVAGTASAITNDGIGVSGVAWNNTILPLVVADSSGNVSYSNLASAITYAADHGAKVINISLGGPRYSYAVQDAVNYAWNKGVVVVAAAGNKASSAPFYPAALNNVVAVSATDGSDNLASFSSYGTWIDVSAPGTYIYTTDLGDNYSTRQGTSFASAQVAGLAALIFSLNPSLSNSQVVDLIRNNADDLGAPGFDPYYGWGRINVARSLRAAYSATPTPPSVAITSPVNGSTVSGPGNAHGSNASVASVPGTTTSATGGTKKTAVATPTITPTGGTFVNSVSVTLQTTTPGGSIYYTTDGTDPSKSSNRYTGPVALTSSTLVKAKAFSSGYYQSAMASAWFTIDNPFTFSLSNSGNQSVSAGSSVTNSIAAALVSGSSQAVSFSVSGLPSGATGSFSSASCAPPCSVVLTVNTSGSTPTGNYPITVASTGAGMTKTTAFMLSITTAVTLVAIGPTGYTFCAPENGTCSFSGTMSVAYGANGQFFYQNLTGGTPCNNTVFGDPIVGTAKACYTGPSTATSSTPGTVTTTTTGPTQSSTPGTVTTTSMTSSTSSTASYYVGKNGSDSNSCAQAQNSSTAKLTIGAALACIGTSPGAGAGQIVEVAAGTYTDSITNNLPSGTSWSSPFTLRAKSGDTVTIRSSAQFNVYIYLPTSLSFYSIIQGFVFDGALETAVSQGQVEFGSCCDGPGFIRLQNNEFINNNGVAITITKDSHDIEIINNKIHGGPFVAPGGAGGGGAFTYPVYMVGSNNLIEGNEIYDFPSWGIHTYSNPSYLPLQPNNNIIRKNKVHDFGSGDARSSGILTYNGNGNQVYNNIVYRGSTVANQGIAVGPGATSTGVYNNTVYGTTFIGISDVGSNTTIKNNIAYLNGTNINFSGATGTNASNNLSVNPSFIDAAGGNFGLLAGSLAIDAGVTITLFSDDINGTPRPQGAAWDIGAVEYK